MLEIPSDVEVCIDLFFEIGKQNKNNENYKVAVKWLERASTLFEHHDLEKLGPDAGDLRLNVFHTYGQTRNSFIGTTTDEVQ